MLARRIRERMSSSPWRGCAVGLAAAVAGVFVVAAARYQWAYWARMSLADISDGLSRYDADHGRLPSAAATDPQSGNTSSWRIEVWQARLKVTAYDYRQAWNSPRNRRLEGLATWLFGYTPRGARPTGGTAGKAGGYVTYYKAVVGPGTAWDPAHAGPMRSLPPDLILVVRVEQSDVHWMEPADLAIETLRRPKAVESLLCGRRGYVVLFADREMWVLSRDTPPEYLTKFFTVEGATESIRSQLLAPYRILP